MKKGIQLLILLLAAFEGNTKCGSRRMDFWPSGETINQNSIFVIDAYGESQDVVIGLGKAHKVYLKSGEEEVRLLIKEICIGELEVTQAILNAEKMLTAGKEYELVIENLMEEDNRWLVRYNQSTTEFEKLKWKVIASIDSIAPSWTSKPVFSDETYNMRGCSPLVFANFKFAINDSLDFLIRTTVKNLSTGKETTYYLKASDSIITVGYGMCSGAFTFNGGKKYEVEFSLMDESGNVTPWTGNRIKFKRPGRWDMIASSNEGVGDR